MDELKKQAEALGIKVDGRWSEDRLREEIEDAQKKATPVVDELEDLEKQEQEQETQSPIGGIMVDLPEASVTVRNLKANPMKSLGLASYGTVEFTETQLALDPALVAKIKRGVELGILSVQE